MTQIAWSKPLVDPGLRHDGAMLIAYSEKNVVIDATWIHDNNTCYFEAKDKRNAIRHESLKYNSVFTDLAEAANDFAKAKERLTNRLSYDELDPDRYALEKVCRLT